LLPSPHMANRVSGDRFGSHPFASADDSFRDKKFGYAASRRTLSQARCTREIWCWPAWIRCWRSLSCRFPQDRCWRKKWLVTVKSDLQRLAFFVLP
jgi:hypothetical protein